MLKTVSFIVLLSFLLGFFFGSVVLADPPEVVFEKAKLYTVKIKTSVAIPFADDSKGTWTGAGFVVDAERRWVVSNAHVTSRSKAIIQVSTYGHEMKPARAVYIDPYFDIAVLEVPSMSGVKQAPMDCEGKVVTGVAVGAFGHPENYNFTGTKGIISGRSSDLSIFGDFLQTDAPINPGNSGGPLINLSSGKVVGMNTAGREKAQNMNWAVPVEQICLVVNLLRQGIDPTPARLPFEFYKDGEMKNTLRVAKVTKHGRGFDVKRDDEVLAVVRDGKRMNVFNEPQLMNGLRGIAGEAELILNRGGVEIKVKGAVVPTKPVVERREIQFSGLVISDLVPLDIEEMLKVDHPLFVDFIEPGSIAENLNLEKSEVITTINGVDCNDIGAAYELLSKAQRKNEPVKLRIQHVGWSNGHMFSYYERNLDVQGLGWVEVASPLNKFTELAKTR